MKRLLILTLLFVFHTASAFGSEPAGTDKSTPVVKTGRVQPLAKLKLDSKPKDAKGIALVQTDGTILSIVEDNTSRTGLKTAR
jgi:hypothetical protein